MGAQELILSFQWLEHFREVNAASRGIRGNRIRDNLIIINISKLLPSQVRLTTNKAKGDQMRSPRHDISW